ncbi:MAG: type II toxin-antitoxin system Phd/YefM family antitoxin [Micrococcales bacterium]
MKKIPATQARQNFAQTLIDCRNEPQVITDHGRPVAVLMDHALAKLALDVLEDSLLLEQAIKAKKRIEAGGKTYSLEEVAEELGIPLAKS